MKLRKRLCIGSLLMVCLVVSLLIPVGCGQKSSTTTTQGTKSLTIGCIAWSGWSMGVSMQKSQQVFIDMINKAGGLQVGQDKYILQYKLYDTNGSQSGAVTAANKAVFEDKIKFATGDIQFPEAFLSIMEDNKVIFSGTSPSQATVKPGFNYVFDPTSASFSNYTILTWYARNYPDKVKNVVLVFADNQMGHVLSDIVIGPVLQALNVTFQTIFYPAEATDLGAIATKVISMNPTTVESMGNGALGDAQMMKAIYQAGYRDMFLYTGNSPAGTFEQFFTAEALEKIIASSSALQFDPPLTKLAMDYKATYIAKYGSWDNPDLFLPHLEGLLGGIQQAGTLDPDKIMSVVYNGMEFDDINGAMYMVPWAKGTDFSKTTDSIQTVIIKTYKDGKLVPTIITPPEGIELYKTINPAYNYSIK